MPTPPDRTISIKVGPEDSARTILAKICWAYGDGMYFTLQKVRGGKKGLIFETNPPLHELSLLETKPQTPKPVKLRPTEKKEIKEVNQEKPVAVTSKPLVKQAPLWAWPSFLLGALVGMGVVYLVLLTKKKASSRGKSRAT